MKLRPRPTQPTLTDDFRPVVTPEAVHKAPRPQSRRVFTRRLSPEEERMTKRRAHEQKGLDQTAEVKRLMAGGMDRLAAIRQVFEP